MSNLLSVDLVLNRQKYPYIYNITLIIFIVTIISIILTLTINYQTYYVTEGKIVNNELELFINLDDLKYLNNKTIYIDNEKKNYQISSINKELYETNYKVYCCIYLNISGLSSIDNYVYQVKIPKENKKLIKYLKDYLS